MPGPGIEPLTGDMPSGRANHYTTAPLREEKEEEEMKTEGGWTT